MNCAICDKSGTLAYYQSKGVIIDARPLCKACIGKIIHVVEVQEGQR